MLIFLLIVSLAILVYAGSRTPRLGLLLNPATWFAGGLAFCYLLGALTLDSVPTSVAFTAPPLHAEPSARLLASIGVLAIAFGVLAGQAALARLHLPRVTTPDEPIVAKRVVQVGWTLFGVGFVAEVAYLNIFYLSIGESYRYGNAESYARIWGSGLAWLSMGSLILVAGALLIYIFEHKMLSKFVPLAIAMALSFTLGARKMVLSIALAALFGNLNKMSRARRRTVFAIFSLIGALFFLVAKTTRHDISPMGINEDVDLQEKAMSAFESDSLLTAGDMSPYWTFIDIFDKWDSMGTLQYGATYLHALIYYVPRALWSDKPVLGASVLVSQDLYGGYGVVPTVFGEMIMNFGPVGVPVLSFLAGILLAAYSSYASRHLDSRIHQLAHAFGLPWWFLAARSDFVTVFSFWIWSSGLILLVGWLVSSSIKAHRANRSRLLA